MNAAPPAGPRPVHHDRALPGEKNVVGADVSVQQRVAGRVIGPRRLQGCQLVQVPVRPGVKTVLPPEAARLRQPVNGTAGWRPATSSRIKAIHGGRSTVPHSRRTGNCRLMIRGSSVARTRPSCRCNPGVSGLACADTAFTKYRVPLAHRTRAARPGLNPPGCVRASTTAAPHTTSIAARTGAGTCSHPMRTPSAAVIAILGGGAGAQCHVVHSRCLLVIGARSPTARMSSWAGWVSRLVRSAGR